MDKPLFLGRYFFIMENQEEIWKDIPEYEGLYQVSNFGRVKSFKAKGGTERILKLSISNHGYYRTGFFSNGKTKSVMAHVLVAVTFLGHKQSGWNVCVDHIDGNKLNNHVSNLRIVSHRYNVSTCYRKPNENKTSKYVGVLLRKSRNNWMARIQIDNKQVILGTFKNEEDAHIARVVADQNIDKYQNNKQFYTLIHSLINYSRIPKNTKGYCISFKKRDNLWYAKAYVGNRKTLYIKSFKYKSDAVKCGLICGDNNHLYNGGDIEFRKLILDLYQKEKEGN